MAICVNTNSKEFKDLFNSMDISKGTLELVLHQMLNNGELEGRPFPTKEEILERLYPSTFEGSNNLVKLWDIKYSEDRVFGSLNRAIEYSREAIKLFGENNVRVIELKEGAKVVVAQPSRESYVKYILDKESNVTIPGKSKPSSNREILKEDYSRSREFEDKVVRTLASKLAGININNLGKEFSTTIKDTKNSERVQSYINNLKKIYGDTITIKVTEYSNGTTAISYKFKTFNSLYNEATKALYSNIDTYLESLTPDKIYEEIGRIESNIENSDKEDNLYYINPNKKEEIVNQILKKVVYTKQVIDSSIAWLETLPNTPEDNLFVKDIINWIKRGSMTNFEMYGSLIREAWDFARSKGADMQKFKTAEDLILWSLEQKAQNINETTSRTYSKEEIDKKFDKFQFSHTVASESGEPIYIYDVEDSAEGRQQVTQILADTTPKDSTGKPIIGSPWCLSTYNYNKETGIATPTSSSEFYWESYGGGKRQIAIYKGRPIAFNSSKENKEAWWDFNDTKSEENILDTDITANTTIIEGKKKSLSKHSEEFMSIVSADRKSMVTAGIFNSIDSQGNQKGGISKTIMLDPKDPTIVNTESYSNIDNELKSNREIELYIETKKNAKPRATISIVTDLGNYNTKAKNLDNAAYNGYENGILIHIKDSNNNRFIIDVARDTLSSNTFDITVGRSIIGTTPGTYFIIKINSDNGKLRLITRDNSGKLIDLDLPSNLIDKIKSIIGEEDLYKYIEESEKHTSRESKIKNDIEWADKSIAILNNIEKIVYVVSELVPNTKIKRIMDTLYSLDHPTKKSTKEEITADTKDTTTKTTKETTETPKVYSTEEAVERRANVQEAYSQSENTERMNTLRREYQKEYEVVSEYSEGTVTTEDVDNVVTQMETGILANMYNEQVRKPINQELNRRLKDILKRFHFEVIEDALMETFGDDILGATDLVQKIIYLASESKQNAITMPEEFAHSFIALMGNSYRSSSSRAKFPDTKLYSELMDLVGETSIFRQVYILYKDAYTDSKGNPNMMALREEALGQALAAVLLNRDKNVSDKDRTFFTKLKEWFNNIINSIRELFGHKDPLSAERQLYKELDSIADSILDGSYFEKYLKKLNPTEYNRVGVADSIRFDIEHNNGKMIDFMRFVNSLGGTIDGSFSYRAQGTVYRPGLDTLHDIDCVIPLNVHGLQTKYPSIARNSQFRRGYWDSAHLEAKIKETDFYKSIKDKYGDSFHFLATYTTGEDVIVNGVICEDSNLVERFISMSGNFNDRLRNFTEEERNRFYLIDFFMVNRNENRIYQSEETDITMSDYVVPFTAKMKMGRAKDIFDYQNFNPNHRTLYRNTGSEQTIFYQKDSNKSTTFNPETAEFYSGAADGADTVWGTKARELGIKVKDYTIKDWDNLPSEWKEKLDKIYKEVVSRLGRRELPMDTPKGKLVRRDMMQAEKADAIFAVSSIGSNGLVDGGTGYATTRGIIRGIPVYVFDQIEGVWKVWDGDKFVKTTQPTLTNNAAVIGTRKINEAGVKAIEDILKSTIESTKTPTTTEKVQWGVTSDNSFEVSTAANRPDVVGDSRFSALNAKFKPGTIIDGVDVGGKTIEYVYQNIIKKSGKGQPPAKDSKLYNESLNTKEELEDFSYYEGYLPLWQEWAKQNPELIEELREKSKGRVLTDRFANKTTVSQARALADILNSTSSTETTEVTTTEETTPPVVTSTEVIEPTTQKDNKPRKEEPSVLDKLIKEAEDEQKSREVATANEKYLKQQLKVTRQLDELYSSNISTTEIGDIASQAVFWISDFITDLQEKKDHATKIFLDKFKDVDFSKMSRVEVIKTIGIDTIVDLCRLKLTTGNDNITIVGERIKANIVSKNWGAIMLRAKVIFPDVEKFSIIASDNGSFDIEENVSIDLDNSTVEDYNSTNEQTDIAELEGNIQEAWTIEQRTQDILATMSDEVRRALQKCYLLDEKGNILKSKWGINRRVTVRSATNSILRWTQGAYTLEKMVAMLKTKIATNPWIKQIVERLESTDTDKTLADGTKIEASESDFKSQFFGIMYKPFQLYSVVSEVVTNEDGTTTTQYKSRIVNRNPALRDAINQVTIQYKLGNHPMFTSNGVVNKTSLKYLKGVYDQLGGKLNDNFDNIDTINSIAEGLTIAASLLGYYSTPEILVPYLDKATFSKMHSTLGYIIKSLENNVNNPNYEPFSFKAKDGNENDGIENNVKNFIRPFTESLEDIAVTAFFDSGKMYQSYVQPSYLTKLIQKLKTEDPEVLKEFLDKEFGGTEWFYTKETGWRNTWLKMIADEGGKILEHKVQLNFNKHNYMKDMSDMEYTISLIAEYFAESARRQDTLVPAWFRVPMMSNKPSSEFIKFYSFRGEFYKDSIVNGLLKIFNQEISRIQTVILRNRDKKDVSYITNFDKNGKRFCFLDFLNTYLDGDKKNSRLGELLKKKIDGTITQAEEVELLNGTKDTKGIEDIIRQSIEERAKRILNEWEAQGIIEEVSKKIPGVGASIEVARANLENFIWNDTLASMNILQLTITDIAFYKNAEDLQKRLAQIHAPGIRGNESAVDYAGNPVTDGKFRSVKLKDWDGFISNVIENIDIVFNRKIEAVDIERQRCIESAKSILKANGIEIENIEDLNIDNSLIQAKIRDYYNNLSEDAQNSIEKVISVLPTLATKKKTLTALKESLTREAVKDENGNVIVPAGLYRQINVTDAQGYSCPTSYRKKAYIFGKWSRKKEALWKRLRNGTYSTSDLEEAFGEPLKPFVYSRLFKSSGVEKAPIKTLNIPIQYKNSEYLLFMADALLRSEDTGRPNILRALYDVMENSHFNPDKSYRTDGIDTIQFESTTKSGLMGAVDITEFLNNPNGEAIAREIMLNNLYKREEAGEIEEVNPETGKKEKRKVYNRSTEYNTDTVDIIPFEDYCIQQEIPEHFMNHEQAHGSQSRYLTISELDSYNYKGEEVKYRVEIDGEMKEVSPKEFIEEYERNIAANIEEKIIEVMDDLGLNNFTSIKDRNIALSKILQREILSSSRYGIDLLLACSLNEDGTFRIPLGDPIQSRRIEQLINSIIKNRVNKQEVPGGPVVQVSNFGTSRMLNIKFKSKDGNLLLTRDEFNKAKKAGTIKGYNTYDDYIKENQRGIAYFEVFAPAYTKELFKEFMNSEGEVDVEAINQISPELLKMVGYRIPTEDKYSMAPLKIVGFLPREAGNAIMMPNDITLINGSDFDIDKMYLMVKKLMIAKRFTVEGNKTMSEAEADYIKHNVPSLTKILDKAVRTNSNLSEEDLSKLTKQRITQFLKVDLYRPRHLDDAVTRELRKAYINYMYYAIEPNRNSRDYRNNKIVDMTFEVLTHETSTDKVLNPGGFDQQKKMGYLVEAYKNGATTPDGIRYTYQELEAMSIEELKDLSIKGKNLCFIDTQVQFYRQNSAAGSLISVFAVNRTAHAVLESANTEGKGTKYRVNVDDAAKIEKPFTVCGMTFEGLMDFDMRYDIEGNLIGKTLGSLVNASVDAVKDPTLNLMNINSNTSNILTSLIRMGMPFKSVALFLSQRCITNILREYSKENIGKSKSLTSIVKERLEKLRKELKVSENGNLAYEKLTEKQLIKGLIEEDAKHEFKVLNTFLRFNGIANALRLPTLATRFNSISSAVGPLVIDNLIMEHKINKLNNNSHIIDENYLTVTVQQIVNDHPILSAFRTAYDVANRALSSIPANSRGFRNIMYSLEEVLPNLSDIIFNDRKLFGQLSDFYQTALLYRTGVVSRNELSYFINEFPKEFLKTKKELREKKEYKDNALLNAMRVTTEGEGENSRIVLKIDLTGIDITEKTRLGDAWIDLHKLNPELSIKLFKYCVYRGGIGFNPKTFMSLLPIYIRERISGYTSTYEKLPSVDSWTIIEQFVRNNWGNDYLVPRYKIPSGDLTLATKGYLLDKKSKQAGYISRKDYIKTRINNKDHLFRVIVPEDNQNPYITLIEVEPLGNNGHYVEIISEVGENRTIPENNKAIETTTIAQDTSESILTDRNTGETKEEIDDTIEYTEQEKIDILYNIFTIEGVRDRDAAKQKVDSEFKSKSDKDKSNLKNSLSKFIESRLKVLNIKYDAKLVEDLVEKLCY